MLEPTTWKNNKSRLRIKKSNKKRFHYKKPPNILAEIVLSHALDIIYINMTKIGRHNKRYKGIVISFTITY